MEQENKLIQNAGSEGDQDIVQENIQEMSQDYVQESNQPNDQFSVPQEMLNTENSPDKKSNVGIIVLSVLVSITSLIIIILGIVLIYNIIENQNKSDNQMEVKPILYLYPTEETELTVKLINQDKLTCTYPKYIDEWNVLAKPNGDLVDLDTGRNLYSLYYECENTKDFKVENDGFVVKGEDSAAFLEEKLAVLGLSEREAEEFIVYWLPILESNEYNYIRFADADILNINMPIEFSVEPDTFIRVLMTYKGLDEPIEVEEQQLTSAERTGFTVVEWGGSEIR